MVNLSKTSSFRYGVDEGKLTAINHVARDKAGLGLALSAHCMQYIDFTYGKYRACTPN